MAWLFNLKHIFFVYISGDFLFKEKYLFKSYTGLREPCNVISLNWFKVVEIKVSIHQEVNQMIWLLYRVSLK